MPILSEAIEGCYHFLRKQTLPSPVICMMKNRPTKISRGWLRLMVCGAAMFLAHLAHTQGSIGDVVYTVGTVTRDSNGQDWAYLVWQTTQPGLTSNRVFAVYSKPGNPSSTAPYSRNS